MSKYSVYIYPNISRESMGSNNPYIDHLKDALDKNGLQITRTPAKNAFLDLLGKGLSSNMIIFNWVENLPARRLGVLQTLIFLAYLPLLKIGRVRIIWIKHNKVSHTKKWYAVSKLIQKALSRYADHIIIHATDAGVTDPYKTLFFPHPSNIRPDDILSPAAGAGPVIDLLIWGSLLPYKGVLEFLRYAKNDPLLQELVIHVVGKCKEDYWQELQQYAGKNTTLVNEYIEEQQLKALFIKSRFILFTYKQQSVISSGVLMDSLVACKRIIASDCGAFRDMAEQQQFVSLFDDFSAIVPLFRENYNNYQLDYRQVREFVAQNSWYSMGSKIKGLAERQTGVQSPNHLKIPETP